MTIEQKLLTTEEFYEMGNTLDPNKRYELLNMYLYKYNIPHNLFRMSL